MPVTAEYLVVDSGGFIKNDLGTLDAMTDNIVTLHEVKLGAYWSDRSCDPNAGLSFNDVSRLSRSCVTRRFVRG